MDFIKRFKRIRRKRRVWRYTVSACSLLVAISTMCALMLPAITVEREADCGIENVVGQEEHVEISIPDQENTSDDIVSSDEELQQPEETEYEVTPEETTPYEKWIAVFDDYCMRHPILSQSVLPDVSDPNAWLELARELGIYRNNAEYTPQKNDLVFLDTDDDQICDSICIVENIISESEISVLKENQEGMTFVDVLLLQDSSFLGFGTDSVETENPQSGEPEDVETPKPEDQTEEPSTEEQLDDLTDSNDASSEVPTESQEEKPESDQNPGDEADGFKPSDSGQPQDTQIEANTEQPTAAETDFVDVLPAEFRDPKLYHGYRETIEYNGGRLKDGLRIKDGSDFDGGDRIVYCYDNRKAFPPVENPPDYLEQNDRCWFTRIENYLESKDDFILQYGPEAKEKVALALYAGHPCNAMGHKEKFNYLTNDEARIVTQQLVWDITNRAEKEYSIYYPPDGWSGTMVLYYNAIYCDVLKNFQPGNVFHQGWLEVTGDFTLVDRGSFWSTGEITTKGEKGTIHFSNVDPGLEILRMQDDSDVTKTGIAVGDTFYIRSVKPLSETQRFTITLSYPQIKFYFYKWAEKGGWQVVDSTGKRIQNLIRVEPTDNVLSQSFEVTLDGKMHSTRSVSVQKEWKGNPTDRVKVILYADNQPIKEEYLTADKGWTHTFTGLPQMKDGREIEYTVDEEDVPGYSKDVQGDMNSGYVITNSEEGYILPETGGIGTTMFTSGGFTLFGISLLIYAYLQISKRGGAKTKRICK